MPKFSQLTSANVRTKRPSAQAAPAVAAVAPAAPPSDKNLENLGFKVSADFNREFRTRAFTEGKKLNELLFAAFDAYKAANP